MNSTDDFEARSVDELSLLKGDRIELVERDDDFGDGWYLGKHMQNAKTGLFPEGDYPDSLDFAMAIDILPNSVHYHYPSCHQYICSANGYRREPRIWPL